MSRRLNLNKSFLSSLDEKISANLQNENFDVSELAHAMGMSLYSLRRKSPIKPDSAAHPILYNVFVNFIAIPRVKSGIMTIRMKKKFYLGNLEDRALCCEGYNGNHQGPREGRGLFRLSKPIFREHHN